MSSDHRGDDLIRRSDVLTAISAGSDWPEDSYGRTLHPELFSRIVNAILAIPADRPAGDTGRHEEAALSAG